MIRFLNTLSSRHYREIVFRRLKKDLIQNKMTTTETDITLGLAAENVYQSKSKDIKALFLAKKCCFCILKISKQKYVH